MIDAAFETDADLARQLDMNRAGTWRSGFGHLRCRRLFFFTYAHRQQPDRVRGCCSELAVAMQTPPLEDLVGVDAVLERNLRHRGPRLQRLLNHPPTLRSTPTPTRANSHNTQITINHPHIITAQPHHVHPAYTRRLRSSGGFEFFQLKFELLDPPPHTSVQTDPTEVETANLPRLPRKSDTAAAIRYALSRWPALARFVDAGQLEIDKNAAERALGRKNYLFAGSNTGGERAAAIYSLLGSAKLNGLDPELYLHHVLDRIADHPISKINDLLPWNVALASQAAPA